MGRPLGFARGAWECNESCRPNPGFGPRAENVPARVGPPSESSPKDQREGTASAYSGRDRASPCRTPSANRRDRGYISTRPNPGASLVDLLGRGPAGYNLSKVGFNPEDGPW